MPNPGSLGDSVGEGERRALHRVLAQRGCPETADEGVDDGPLGQPRRGEPLL